MLVRCSKRAVSGGPRVLGRRGFAAVVGMLLLANASEVLAQESRGITMRERVYEKLSRAQEAADAKDFAKAFEFLQDVEKMRDLEPYEKAQLYTAYGFIYFTQEKYAQSIQAYEKVLQQENLPPALQASTLYTLAQLQFHAEDYGKAIQYLERWLSNATNPGPEPYVLLGQAYYQLERYREAVAPVERALAIARERDQPIKENWYLLLRAIYYELEDYPKLLEVLEILVTQFPRKQYWIDLGATYSAMGDEKRQLAAYDVAYAHGYLDGAREIVLYAQLLLQANAPYRAGVVLQKGLADGVLQKTVQNYKLLSQASILAREDTQAIEALTQAAKLSDDGELDARLAQSYANLDDWENAIKAARSALEKGVEDAHDMHVLIGMAHFEKERYDEAKTAFRLAQKSPDARGTASKWIVYIESEERRLQELRRSLN